MDSSTSVEQHSLLLVAPYTLEWDITRLAAPGPGELLVRTIISGISIGTERALFTGRRVSPATLPPRTTGYENVGIVIAQGDDIADDILGRRIVASYGHRNYAVVPYERATQVPEDITDEEALLLILACDAATAVEHASVTPQDHVLVTGAGIMGLLVIFNLKARGIRRVDLIEPLKERRDLGMLFGAESAYSSPEQITDRYDIGFECADSDSAFESLQELMKKKGRICIVADGNFGRYTLCDAFHEQQLVVIGSSDEPLYRRYAPWYFAKLREEWRDRFDALPFTRIPDHALIDMFKQIGEGAQPLKVIAAFPSEE